MSKKSLTKDLKGMFDKPVYNYPLEKILEALGAKRGPQKDKWFSPLRDEKDASLHIDTKKNLWYDFGLGEGGTNVKLVQLVLRCSKAEAIRFIKSLSPELRAIDEAKKQLREDTDKKKSRITSIKEITSDYLARYLEIRGVPLRLARIYCKQLQVYNPAKEQQFTMLGFPNNAGGFAMKSPNGMKSTDRAAVTTLTPMGQISKSPSSANVAVFEGFMDFLSWRVMQGEDKPGCDTVVLNSVAHLKQAADYIAAHASATCFLDNDEAGRECLHKIESIMEGKEVKDMSELYHQHKDLNEMLQASRGYHSGLGIRR